MKERTYVGLRCLGIAGIAAGTAYIASVVWKPRKIISLDYDPNSESAADYDPTAGMSRKDRRLFDQHVAEQNALRAQRTEARALRLEQLAASPEPTRC